LFLYPFTVEPGKNEKRPPRRRAAPLQGGEFIRWYFQDRINKKRKEERMSMLESSKKKKFII
jgi:hypothetical protein